MRNSIESLIARGLSILSKFLLIGLLVKELSLYEYGNFQLISYFVLLSTTIFGLEYYNVSNRELVLTSDKFKIYNTHISFFLSLLGVIIIIQIISFYFILPKQLTSLSNFLIILIICLCDYISQEIYRYLMISKKFREANIQLIYKSFFFFFFLIIHLYIHKTIDFKNVLFLMLFSYLLLLILSLITFNKELCTQKIRIDILSLKKIKIVFSRLSPFIILIFFVKGIEFSDKFIVAKILGAEDLGVYAFLYTMGSVLNIFIVSGFYLIYLPELINKYKTDKKAFVNVLVKFSKLNIGFSLFLFLGIFLTKSVVFVLIDKSEFLNYPNLLLYILVGFVFNNISLIPHVYLYVSNNEKSIMHITGLAFILNLFLTFYFIDIYGIIGAAFSFVCTYIFILISKSIVGYVLWKKDI